MADSEDFCCDVMRCSSRRHWPHVPEAEQRDAFVEYRSEEPRWMLLYPPDPQGRFGFPIAYCPWCGAELAGFKP